MVGGFEVYSDNALHTSVKYIQHMTYKRRKGYEEVVLNSL